MKLKNEGKAQYRKRRNREKFIDRKGRSERSDWGQSNHTTYEFNPNQKTRKQRMDDGDDKPRKFVERRKILK